MVTCFSQFAGNGKTLEQAKEMLTGGRVPQALLLEGPVGSGRTTLAMLLAGGLLCGEDLPCGNCPVCQKVFGSNHPDVTLVQPANHKSAISVDQIRTVRGDAFVLPGEGSCKVFILRGLMNDAAQNALLKILEEPPGGVYFILVGEHRNQYMDTVLSRTSVLSLRGVSFEEALPVLQQAGYPVAGDTKERFEMAGGLLGALLASNDRLQTAKEIAAALAETIAHGRREDFLRAVAPGVEDRGSYSPILDELYCLFHHALAAQTGQATEQTAAALLARRLTKQELLRLGEVIRTQQKTLLYNPNGWLFFTDLCAQIFPRK